MKAAATNPQQQFKPGAFVPSEVLFLYTDPKWLKTPGEIPPGERDCWVFMHPAPVLGHYTHQVPWGKRACQVANSERCLT
jgi:hypothetical protein